MTAKMKEDSRPMLLRLEAAPGDGSMPEVLP